MHHRRARPTLRVLVEDLTVGWESPNPRRLLADGRHRDLHPLSELPHPIIAKALESFGHDPANDNFVGPILSSGELGLLEIKVQQWRGGIWIDPKTGVCWLVAAGLAKGNHKDNDDFYEQLARAITAGHSARYLPTEHDIRLLKQETAARLLTVWELDIQRKVLDALRAVAAGGSARLTIEHPILEDEEVATVVIDVTPVREESYDADEITVEIDLAPRFASAKLGWTATLRVLISIHPPEQSWDRYRNTYSNVMEPGGWQTRAEQLATHVATGELPASIPGSHSHYTHRKHIAGSTIDGTALRAICGVFFVPMRDHASLPVCPNCDEAWAGLPAS